MNSSPTDGAEASVAQHLQRRRASACVKIIATSRHGILSVSSALSEPCADLALDISSAIGMGGLRAAGSASLAAQQDPGPVRDSIA